MKTVLITGANKGIGFETARQMAEQGYFVYLACRDAGRGHEAVEKLKSMGLDHIGFIEMDVTSDASVAEALKTLENQTDHLDVLVNNAGILGQVPQPPSKVSMETVHKVFETNLFGVIRVTQAFLEMLKKSEAPRIVNVTSELGSLTLHNDPNWQYYPFKSGAYAPSKAALNAYTVMLAYELRDSTFKVNTVNPGHTATDFNNNRGTATPAHAAKVIVKYASLDESGPTGGFFSEDGATPW